MDATDQRIIEILRREGRIPMSQLAERINMSAPSAIERVRKLEDAGVIQGYHARISPKALGCGLEAIMLLTFIDNARFDAFLRFAPSCPEILDCMAVTGSCDVCLRVACRDMDDYLRLLEIIHAYAATDTFVIAQHTMRDGLPVA